MKKDAYLSHAPATAIGSPSDGSCLIFNLWHYNRHDTCDRELTHFEARKQDLISKGIKSKGWGCGYLPSY